jgi:transposase
MLPKLTIGLDLGDKISRTYGVDRAGARVFEGEVTTTRAGIEEYFRVHAKSRVILEVGTHSPWVSRSLSAMGHEVVVANPSAVYGKRRRRKRNDRMDAEFLARQGRADIQLLHPIQHRGVEAQQHLEILHARDQLVRARTKLINHVRGTVKSLGHRIRSCSAESFVKWAGPEIPSDIRVSVSPLLEVIDDLTTRIRTFDQQIEHVVSSVYPEAVLLQQPKGVGPVTSLAYLLIIDDPDRFKRSRDVGAYVGLVPRLDESGDSTPQLRITKAGDELLRRLLVSSAQYILGVHGPDCDLRRYGERIAKRGGKNAKKRAVVAVARKLAVLLHRLWISESSYDPDYLMKRHAA